MLIVEVEPIAGTVEEKQDPAAPVRDEPPQPITAGCTWCGGSGTWIDPEGKSWPCIQCNPVGG